MTLVPGTDPLGRTKLASYELVHRLAVGGMGEVFLARHRGDAGIERLVALKRMLPGYADREGAVESFIDEARLAATLSHPNIVHVLDFGAEDGEYFLAMELVLGHDLARIAARGGDAAFSRPLAAYVVGEIVRALDHVHHVRDPHGESLGIVHRDISPSNVLVSYDGDVKLMDFGIAKGSSSTFRTRTGAVRGKVAYMAPEQLAGGAVDARSDLYAAGIVLWELALGRRLFTGINELEIASKVALAEIPRPRSLDPDFPPVLEDVVMAVLQPDPEQRLQSAAAFGEALRTYLRSASLPDPRSALGALVQTLFAAERKHVSELIRSGHPDRSGEPAIRVAPIAPSQGREAGATVVTSAGSIALDASERDPLHQPVAEHATSRRSSRVLRYAAVPALLVAGALGGVWIAGDRDREVAAPTTEPPPTPRIARSGLAGPRSVAKRRAGTIAEANPESEPAPAPAPAPDPSPPRVPRGSVSPAPVQTRSERVKANVRGGQRAGVAAPATLTDPFAAALTARTRLHPDARAALISRIRDHCRKTAGIPYKLTFSLRVRADGQVVDIRESSDLGRAAKCIRDQVYATRFLKGASESIVALELDAR